MITQYCNSIKDNPNAPIFGHLLALKENGQSDVVRHFGLQLLENAIRYKWIDGIYGGSEREQIKQAIINLVQNGTHDILIEKQFIKEKVAKLFADVARREWPTRWTDMNSLLRGLYISSESDLRDSLTCIITSYSILREKYPDGVKKDSTNSRKDEVIIMQGEPDKDDADNKTTHYIDMDFDSSNEYNTFALAFRTRLVETIKLITQMRPIETFTWIVNRIQNTLNINLEEKDLDDITHLFVLLVDGVCKVDSSAYIIFDAELTLMDSIVTGVGKLIKSNEDHDFAIFRPPGFIISPASTFPQSVYRLRCGAAAVLIKFGTLMPDLLMALFDPIVLPIMNEWHSPNITRFITSITQFRDASGLNFLSSISTYKSDSEFSKELHETIALLSSLIQTVTYKCVLNYPRFQSFKAGIIGRHSDNFPCKVTGEYPEELQKMLRLSKEDKASIVVQLLQDTTNDISDEIVNEQVLRDLTRAFVDIFDQIFPPVSKKQAIEFVGTSLLTAALQVTNVKSWQPPEVYHFGIEYELKVSVKFETSLSQASESKARKKKVKEFLEGITGEWFKIPDTAPMSSTRRKISGVYSKPEIGVLDVVEDPYD
ncbi:5377_t:CDS:10, partial [Racocetra fulgida]